MLSRQISRKVAEEKLSQVATSFVNLFTQIEWLFLMTFYAGRHPDKKVGFTNAQLPTTSYNLSP